MTRNAEGPVKQVNVKEHIHPPKEHIQFLFLILRRTQHIFGKFLIKQADVWKKREDKQRDMFVHQATARDEKHYFKYVKKNDQNQQVAESNKHSKQAIMNLTTKASAK